MTELRCQILKFTRHRTYYCKLKLTSNSHNVRRPLIATKQKLLWHLGNQTLLGIFVQKSIISSCIRDNIDVDSSLLVWIVLMHAKLSKLSFFFILFRLMNNDYYVVTNVIIVVDIFISLSSLKKKFIMLFRGYLCESSLSFIYCWRL